MCQIKRTKRDAWKRPGHWDIAESESVGDHTFSGALTVFDIAYELEIPDCDPYRAAVMFLCHDLYEDEVTDINIWTELDPEARALKLADKKRQERARLEQIRIELGPKMGEFVYQIVTEYEEGKTPAAKLAKQGDKLDVLMQALDYGEAGNPVNIWEFWGNVWPRVHLEELKIWLTDEIYPRVLAIGGGKPPEGFSI